MELALGRLRPGRQTERRLPIPLSAFVCVCDDSFWPKAPARQIKRSANSPAAATTTTVARKNKCRPPTMTAKTWAPRETTRSRPKARRRHWSIYTDLPLGRRHRYRRRRRQRLSSHEMINGGLVPAAHRSGVRSNQLGGCIWAHDLPLTLARLDGRRRGRRISQSYDFWAPNYWPDAARWQPPPLGPRLNYPAIFLGPNSMGPKNQPASQTAS